MTRGRTPGVNLTKNLADELRKKIVSEEWPPGYQLPSEQELMSEHKVSRPTVRNAIKLLEGEGLVITIHGKGSFVAKLEPTHRLDIVWHGPDRLAGPSISYVPDPLTKPERKCVQRTVTVSKRLAKQFGFDVDASVVERVIRLLVADRPILTSTSYVLPELAEDADEWHGTCVGELALSGHTAISPYVEERSRMPTQTEYADLAMSPGVPVCFVTRRYQVLFGEWAVPAGVTVVVRGDEVLVQHYSVGRNCGPADDYRLSAAASSS